MKTSKSVIFVFVFALAIALAGITPAPAKALMKVRFAFGTPTVQVLALNIAIGKYLGYYEEEGIDFNILAAGSNTATMQGLATGKFDMGVFVPATILPLAAKGSAPPFVAFYNYTPKFKYDFVTKPGSDIKSVEQLKGKIIGIPKLGHSSNPVVRAVLRQHNIDPEKDVRIVVAGYGPTAGDMIKRGKIDAFFAGDTDFGRIEAVGFKLQHMGYKVAGDLKGIAGFYLGATENFIKSNPKACVGVGRAVAKATVFALANLPMAAEAFLKLYPTAVAKGKTRKEAIADIVHIIGARSKNWVREDVKPHKWGIMLKQDFENERKFLKLEDKLPDLSKFYTNQFIDEINNFDAEKIRHQAKNFKLK
ncbi:MAG: ABC transporter substrate-binding protein [Deltaproteobacteria bacterium]|nr:ABC transporter substrate-binding protein [Deltaproteobacteria bacterium]MBW2306951.1 ABC transporter substrate-binding protein [Deltaproteobacteria bacterium]